MSIAFQTTEIRRPTFAPTISPYISIFPASMPPEDPPPPPLSGESSAISSLHCSGDSPSDGDDSGEVQSAYKGPLDTMDALEASLPIRRGISRFYCGKSKSFASLADACSLSGKDLGKPDNAYSRRRKNILACSNLWDKNRTCYVRTSVRVGISKKPTSHARSTLALAVSMSNSESSSCENHESLLPPLHQGPINRPFLRRSLSSRSVLLTDLQGNG